jgi:hypothetical protein
MLKRKVLLHVVLAMVTLSVGCQRERGEVLLRYTPQAGSTYRYKFEINHPYAPIEVTGEMHVLSKDEDGYQLQFSGMNFDELFSGSLIVSDRHNTSDPGYISLNFPDDPVGPGTEWSGEIPWYFENDYVLDTTELRLPASYKLLEIEQGENGRHAIIEQRVEADVAVDGLVFHVGQVGVRWNHEGKITEVHQGYDACGKLRVGDVVVGINGHRAGAAGELRLLAEKHIQHPKEARTVTLTILRDGKEYDVNVEKSIDKLAVVKVHNWRSMLTVKYDVDRGLLSSAESNYGHDVVFTSPATEPFPVVDDYGGFSKFGYLEGKTTYQDHYGDETLPWIWRLSLVSGEEQ